MYMKTPERAHCIKNLWEKVKLSKNFIQALEQISKHLEHWHPHQVNRAKQRLTKLRQRLATMRRVAVQQASGKGTTLVPIKKKTERRETQRELKAETAAKLPNSIEQELLARLRNGMYGDRYKRPSENLVTASDKPSKRNHTRDKLRKNCFVEDICETEDERLEVDPEEVSQMRLEENTQDTNASQDIEDLGSRQQPIKKRKKKRREKVLKQPQVLLEYEEEMC